MQSLFPTHGPQKKITGVTKAGGTIAAFAVKVAAPARGSAGTLRRAAAPGGFLRFTAA